MKEHLFDITYHNTRLGVPCVKKHVIVAETQEKAINGLCFWKGSTPADIIKIEDLGERTQFGSQDKL